MPIHLTSIDTNVASGIAGLNPNTRTTKGVDTIDDLIVDGSSKGLVLKDTLGVYWRISIGITGIIGITSLGTTKP